MKQYRNKKTGNEVTLESELGNFVRFYNPNSLGEENGDDNPTQIINKKRFFELYEEIK